MPVRHPGWPRHRTIGIDLAVLSRQTFVGSDWGGLQGTDFDTFAEVQVWADGQFMADNYSYLPFFFD